jgi:hypothetical protein
MKPTAEQVAAFAGGDLEAGDLAALMSKLAPPAAPPSPWEIALRLAGALLASGRFADDQTAAVEVAWTLVIPFYQGRATYERLGLNLANVARFAVSETEGDMSAAERRAYVTGGETGDTGEAGEGAALAVMPGHAGVDLAAITARQIRIAETTTAVQEASIALDLAARAFANLPADADDAARDAARAAAEGAQAAFDQAAAAQSAAYE